MEMRASSPAGEDGLAPPEPWVLPGLDDPAEEPPEPAAKLPAVTSGERCPACPSAW